MKYFLYVFIALFSIQSYAAASRDEYLLQRQIQAVEHQNKVYGIRAVVARENVPISGTTQTQVRELIKRSIAVDTPTPTKVGSSMLKRIYSPQAIVGTAAVTGLLAAIGWVMEDGAYVKRIPPEPDKDPCSVASIENCPGQYVYASTISTTVYYFTSADAAGNHQCLNYSPGSGYTFAYTNPEPSGSGNFRVYCYKPSGSTFSLTISKVFNPNPIPEPSDKDIVVPLTAALLGAAMLGRGYSDPDPKFDNGRVNTDVYTGVAETYEHDPSGVGDEVADDMDDKLDKAPQTPDNTPSPIPDPNYDNVPLDPDSDKADRSWTEKGDEASGTTTPTKDPVTGEDTGGQSISLQFPLFCSWASKMCQWYDDWKESDQVYKDHMTKTEDHQGQEKSFWQTVKDWFDWTKEEPEPEPDEQQPEPDDQGIFTRTFDTSFSLSKECPPDIPINFESTYLTGSYTFSMNWLCIIFSFMAYPLVFLSHCIGIWILYEAATRKEIKW